MEIILTETEVKNILSGISVEDLKFESDRKGLNKVELCEQGFRITIFKERKNE